MANKIEIELELAQIQARQDRKERDEARQRKDAAYLERNQVVALLARLFPSGIRKTAIEEWDEEWHGCVYIDLPTGQVSWHYHDSHAHLFADLPPYFEEYDGHTTEEKYKRVQAVDAADLVERHELIEPVYVEGLLKERDEARPQVAGLREALQEVEDYMDQRADAEYFTDSPAPVGNEEMRLLGLVRAVLTDIAEAAAGWHRVPETYRERYKRELLAAAPTATPDPEDG